jgi:polyhydroxyalkanoate synthase
MTWLTLRAVLPVSRNGLPPLKPHLEPRASELRRELENLAPEVLTNAVERVARRRFEGLMAAILAYRHHPYRRDLADPPVIWREGTTRLLDYGGAGKGTPVLLVTSLINRFYIVDLSARRSLVRFLAAHGMRPLVIDWGPPGEEERRFSLDDYVAGRLARAFKAAQGLTAGPMPVVGYCMGGLLALALALRHKREVSGLALLATPWDFHAEAKAQAQAAAVLVKDPFVAIIEKLGELPVDVLQALFYWLDPYLSLRKFLAFSRLDPASSEARDFVALEDWANDGVPLAAAVARECLGDWYGANTPGRGSWRMAGQTVRPQHLAAPSLVIVPQRDRIVPPASALALAERLPGARVMAPPLGHIGMVVSRRAPELVWRPLLAWLREVAHEPASKRALAPKRRRSRRPSSSSKG